MTDKQSPAADGAPDLHLPEGIRYTCHQSGLCCPVFPRIPVDPESEQRLRQLDYQRLEGTGCAVRSPEEAMAAEPGSHGGLVLRRRGSDHNCVFYSEDRLCAIHKTFGEPAKPQVCRDFPYRYRKTPGGLYVGLSFVCPSVRGNRGKPVSEQRAELAEAASRALRHEDASGPILFNRKLALSWRDYLDLEQGFYDLLDRTDVPLAQRLIALRVLTEFVDLLEQKNHGAYVPMAPPRQAVEGEIGELVATLRRTGYSEVLRPARRDAGSPLLRRMFLGMLTGFGNSMWEGRGRLALVAGLLSQYARHASALGRVELKPVPKKVSHRRLARVRFPAAGPAAELLERYFRHCIFRKDLLLAPSVTRGLNLLLINAALVRWYAAALAAEGNRAEPAGEDFSEAVRHVETYYGLQSKFYRALAEQTALEEILDSFTRRKNFPFVILSEE